MVRRGFPAITEGLVEFGPWAIPGQTYSFQTPSGGAALPTWLAGFRAGQPAPKGWYRSWARPRCYHAVCRPEFLAGSRAPCFELPSGDVTDEDKRLGWGCDPVGAPGRPADRGTHPARARFFWEPGRTLPFGNLR